MDYCDYQTGKTTAIGYTAVRETIASLGIMGTQLRAPFKLLIPTLHYRIEGLKGVPYYAGRR